MLLLNMILSCTTIVTAAVILKRDPSAEAQTLISDVGNIDAGVLVLTKDVKAYQGGLLSSTPISVDIITIHLANRKGYADANLVEPFGPADSEAIVKYTTNTVAVDIPASVDATIAKKQQFVDAGIEDVVLAGIKLLKEDHDTFSAALENKLAADSLPAGAAAVAVIDDALQHAIDVFSS